MPDRETANARSGEEIRKWDFVEVIARGRDQYVYGWVCSLGGVDQVRVQLTTGESVWVMDASINRLVNDELKLTPGTWGVGDQRDKDFRGFVVAEQPEAFVQIAQMVSDDLPQEEARLNREAIMHLPDLIRALRRARVLLRRFRQSVRDLPLEDRVAYYDTELHLEAFLSLYLKLNLAKGICCEEAVVGPAPDGRTARRCPLHGFRFMDPHGKRSLRKKV